MRRLRVADWYPQFAAAVRDAGYFTGGVEKKGRWSRTTVCSQGGRGVLGGNSFWVTSLDGVWYLGTWGPRLYRLPQVDDLLPLVVDWFGRRPNDLPADFDEAVKDRFGLVSVSDQEFEEAVRRSQ